MTEDDLLKTIEELQKKIVCHSDFYGEKPYRRFPLLGIVKKNES